jgi:hypothetical protein
VIIILIAVGFYIYYHQQNKKYQALQLLSTKTDGNYADVNDLAEHLKKRNKYLEHVKTVDEYIFNFIRCINIPRSPLCKGVEGDSNICRSRQIDCNKFKLVLENDPIAVDRMKLATDQYTQSNKPTNPSDLTYPVRSGWMF